MSDLSFWSLPDVAKKDFRVVVGIGKCIEQRIEECEIHSFGLTMPESRKAIIDFI